MKKENFEISEVYTITVGLFDRESKKQEIKTAEAMEMITRYTISYCGGGTIMSGNGVYTHDDGTVVVEPSIIIRIVDGKFEDVSNLVKDLQTFLNQESILVEIEEKKYCFVE